VSVRPGGSTYGLPVEIVEDRIGEGPLAGLHAGLGACPTPWLLVMACDVPFVQPDVLRSIANARAPDLRAVVPETDDGRLQPLCACYHVSALPIAEAHLCEGRLKMHDFIRALDPVRTLAFSAETFRNVNRVEDLKSITAYRRA